MKLWQHPGLLLTKRITICYFHNESTAAVLDDRIGYKGNMTTESAFKKSPLIFFAMFVAFCCILLAWRDLGPTKFPPLMRITRSSGAHGSKSLNQKLEVPVVRYTRGGMFEKPTTVDFIGAVHLGEGDYYKALNALFVTYDSVLFELIADTNRIKSLKAEGNDSSLGMIQRKLSELLGLRFQLDEVNYQAANFVHADMNPEQLMKAMKVRGETLPQLLIRLFKISFDPKLQKSLEDSGFSAKELEGINPVMMLVRGPTPEERAIFKSFMAHGLLASDQVLKALEGESGSVIIADRNKVAVSVLEKELAAGKQKLAIYYGVGHLPDMHRRLTEQLGFKLSSVTWMPAWNL